MNKLKFFFGKNTNKELKQISLLLTQVFNKWQLLSELAGVLGLKVTLEKGSQKNKLQIDTNKIKELIKNRTLAKANKDFILADQIRNELTFNL